MYRKIFELGGRKSAEQSEKMPLESTVDIPRLFREKNLSRIASPTLRGASTWVDGVDGGGLKG